MIEALSAHEAAAKAWYDSHQKRDPKAMIIWLSVARGEAQDAKTKREFFNWLQEPCKEHSHRRNDWPFEDTNYSYREQCPECMQALRKWALGEEPKQ